MKWVKNSSVLNFRRETIPKSWEAACWGKKGYVRVYGMVTKGEELQAPGVGLDSVGKVTHKV